MSDVQSHAQKKGECFKDLYIRDLVIASRMKWRGKFHNVETSHFQEEWVARGLELDHDKEEHVRADLKGHSDESSRQAGLG